MGNNTYLPGTPAERIRDRLNALGIENLPPFVCFSATTVYSGLILYFVALIYP